MRRPTDNIEIKDPPLEELTRKHSCLKRTCLSCFTFFVVLVGGSFLILKFTLGAPTEKLKKLPRELARAVPIYDAENVEEINFTSGDRRSRGVEAVAFAPKLVVAPLLLTFDKENRYLRRYRPELADELNKITATKERFWLFMREPVGDHRDLIKIDWLALTAERDFIADYYETELKKKNFAVTERSESAGITQFSFSKKLNDGQKYIDGVVYVEDSPQTEPTDRVTLTVAMEIANN